MSYRSFLLTALAATVLLTAPVIGADTTSGIIEVELLGRPSTAFSKKPVNTAEELTMGLTANREDLIAILNEVKAHSSETWDATRLVDSLINSARQGNVESAMLPVGRKLDWMASRKYRKPRVLWNVKWVGKQPIDAWLVEAEDDNTIYTFVIPKQCMNLSVISEDETLRPRPKVLPPTCELDASWSLPSNDVVVKVSGSYDTVTVEGLEGAGPSWTFQAPSEGQHTFTATARNAAGEVTCTDSVAVTWPNPTCTLSASLTDERTGAGEIRASGEFDEITLFTQLPNGAAGSTPTSAGQNTWTYDPRDDGRRAGTYTFTGDVRNRFGKTAQCTPASYDVPKLDKWTVRVFGGPYDADDRSTPVDTATLRDSVWVDKGKLFGASIEYKPTDKLGIEAGFMLADQDAHWMYDSTTQWLMDEESLDTQIIALGVNWHLLDPASTVDLFVGPFVGFVSFDDIDFADGNQVRNVDFDSETTFGAQLGLGIGFGESPVSFQASIKYLNLDADDDVFDLGLDPLVGTVGLGFKF